MERKLTRWKKQSLSKGVGCLTLIKSTLSSLPIYFMSIFVISRMVCCKLEKFKRTFFGEGGFLENKPHLVSWHKFVSQKRKEGGLGIQNLSILNKALLGKWS